MALSDRDTKRKAWLTEMLSAIDARMIGDLSGGGAEMAINGRSLKRYSLTELDGLRRRCANELDALENRERGASQYSSVRVRL